MATKSIIRLMDSARATLPVALDGPLRLELFNVVKDFLQRTNVWEDEVAFTALPDTWEYQLTEAIGLVNRLLWLEGKRANVANKGSGSRVLGTLTQPGGKTVTMRVHAPPSASEQWYAHVALTVADPTDAEGLPIVPDWITDKYHLTLLNGMLGRMMLQPAKPYTNTALGASHLKEYRVGVALAVAEHNRSYATGVSAWRFPRNFRTRSQRF